MNPWQAKEYGLVDDVIDDGKPGLVAPIADASPLPKSRLRDIRIIEGKVKKKLPSELALKGNEGGDDKGTGQEETPAAL